MKQIAVVVLFSTVFFAIGYFAATYKPFNLDSGLSHRVQPVDNASVSQDTNRTSIIVVEQHAANQSRYTEREKEDLLDVVRQSFYRQAVEILIETMPVSDLVPLTAYISGFDADFLWQIQDPHTFTKNLVSLYIENCGDVIEPAASFAPVRFARQADNNTDVPPPFYQEFSLNKTAPRIYAHFGLPEDYTYDEVLVRWCSPDKNIIYGPYIVDRQRNLNYVWWEPFEAEEGNYYVYVWTVAQQPQLIALGFYEVIE